MIPRPVTFVAVLALLVCGCDAGRQTRAPLSMQVIVLNATQLPDGDKWNELVGRPVIAVEYEAQPESTIRGRSLYLYDGRTGAEQ